MLTREKTFDAVDATKASWGLSHTSYLNNWKICSFKKGGVGECFEEWYYIQGKIGLLAVQMKNNQSG